MLSECTYCSTPLNPTSEDQTILACSFCGKVLSVEEEWQTLRLKRKLRGSRRTSQEVECEQSCVTTADCLENDTDLSDSDSTASSKVVDVLTVFITKSYAPSEAAAAADEANVTVSRKSTKRK